MYAILAIDLKSQISNLRSQIQNLITVPPHVTPPPNAVNSTKLPSLTRPDSIHSSSAIGIDADDVLPCSAMFEYTFSSGTPSRDATASVIRWLAWCGMT